MMRRNHRARAILGEKKEKEHFALHVVVIVDFSSPRHKIRANRFLWKKHMQVYGKRYVFHRPRDLLLFFPPLLKAQLSQPQLQAALEKSSPK